MAWETKDTATSVLAGLALVVSAISLHQSCSAVTLTQRSLKTHLQPELRCVLDEHPEHQGIETFRLFTLINDGSIAAVNTSVRHATFKYERDKQKIRMGGGAGGPKYDYPQLLSGERWIFEAELGPGEKTQKLAGQSLPLLPDGTNANVRVLLFDVTAYRETDGQEFRKRCTFFQTKDGYFTSDGFGEDPDFATIQEEVDRWVKKLPEFPIPGRLEE